MVGQQRASATEDALAKMRQAEQKVVASLKHASLALRALSAVDASQSSTPFNQHSDAFISNLHDAQKLIRERIQQLGADLPFENIMMRRLIEADLAVQRTAHVHRGLVYALSIIDESATPDATAPQSGPTAQSVPSPQYMPSPVASTPQGVFPAVATSPPLTAAAGGMSAHGTDPMQTTFLQQPPFGGVQAPAAIGLDTRHSAGRDLSNVDQSGGDGDT